MCSPDSRKLVTSFVNFFSNQLSCNTIYLKNAWEEELGLQIENKVWEKSLSKIHSCSINARHKLIQFKVLHRLHYSKTKLHKIFPSTSPLCDRCKCAEGSLTHLFWTCTKLYNFWHEIFQWFGSMYNCQLLPEPTAALFGISPSLLRLSSSKRHTVVYGMIIAKKVILTLWKTDTIPQFKMWLTEITNILHMEKVRYTVSDRLDKFTEIWQPFIDYLAQHKDTVTP